MRLVIDPGHGGADSGAVGRRYKEKDLNLLYGELLGFRTDFEFMDTRSGDETVSLENRVEVANGDWEAQAFISIHCNSNEGPPAHGFEIFHYPGSVRGQALAEAICDNWGNLSHNRGVKSANYHVLRETHCPAVLIELGFINHPVEEERLGELEFAMEATGLIEDGVWDWTIWNG